MSRPLSEMGDEPLVVMVAVPSSEVGKVIAHALVEKRIAACVQALPMSSTYRWEGEIETADEVLLLVKTRASVFSDLEALVLTLHPYELPEIVSVPTGAIHGPYRDWLLASVS